MSRLSTSFQAERQLPAETVQELVPSPSSGNQTAVATSKAAKSHGLRRVLLAATAIALLAGAGKYGFDYLSVGRFLVSTDDAYVKADNTTIAPKIGRTTESGAAERGSPRLPAPVVILLAVSWLAVSRAPQASRSRRAP